MPDWNIPVKTFGISSSPDDERPLSATVYRRIPGGYASAVSLARNIKSLRRAANLTQGELGDRLGVEQSAVSKWETGKAEPDASMLPVIARQLDSRVDALLRGIDAQYDANDQPRHAGDQRSGSHQGGPGDVAASLEQRARLRAQIIKLQARIDTLETRLRDVRDGARHLAKLASGRIESPAAARSGA